MPRPKANKKVLVKAAAAAKSIPYGREASSKATKQKNKTPSKPVVNSLNKGKDVDKRHVHSQILKVFRGLEEELKSVASPTNAVAMKRYMRGQFEFLGIQAPVRRAASKQVSGTRLSSTVEHSLMVRSDRSLMVDSLSYISCQTVLLN